MVVRVAAQERHRNLRIGVDAQPEDVGPGVVPGDVEVELAPDDLVEIELGGDERLAAASRGGQDLAERIDDALPPAMSTSSGGASTG